MRVLLASPYGGVSGGISRWTGHIMEYYNTLNEKDIHLDLLPMGRNSFVSKNTHFLVRVKSAFFDYRLILSNFKRKLKQQNYDILHLTTSASLSLIKDLYMIKLAKSYNLKTVIHFRFGRIPDLSISKNWEWKLLCMILKLVDTAIVIDKHSYQILLDSGFKNVVYLPNVVSTVIDVIKKKNTDIVRVPRTILYVGHVLKTKGVFELVEACQRIPNIQLRLIGHILPDMEVLLKKSVNDARWLQIEGEKPYEDIIKAMMSCDLFVFPSYTEGFPNVILETMACGCAIIATKVGAIPEMLESENEESYGLLIDSRNCEQIKNAIEILINDDLKKNRMRSNVQRRVNERYGIETVWKQMICIWNELLIRKK